MIIDTIPVKQIRLIMEYRSFPMWLCDENGIQIAEGLVEELQDDHKLYQELQDVQQIYDGLFIDNKIEFSFRRFASEDEEKIFQKRLQAIADYVQKQVGEKYFVRNSF